MRPSLLGCFDLGKSFGLSDSVFSSDQVAPELDIGLVGLSNPLGRGIVLDLVADVPAVVQQWRDAAGAQLARPELEIGWNEQVGVGKASFRRALAAYVSGQTLTKCEFTIYAVGTVFVRIEFAAGMDHKYVPGILECFEYAAYTKPISEAFQRTADQRVMNAVDPRSTGLVELSRRRGPEITRDARGYEESKLFTGFTTVLLCVDDGDEDEVPDQLRAWNLENADIVEFEYHGKLHYSWAICVLEPRDYAWRTKPEGEQETPDQQIGRMLTCIRIAHVFLGTCEAFTNLFRSEIHEQVGRYIGPTSRERNPRGPRELNRLRTLALAVVNLTRYNLVTPTEEDQEYFAKFEANAKVERHHELISEACDVLYNVQAAEQQEEDSQRQNLLNTVVLLLTSFALISVTADAYSFIRERDDPLIRERLIRFNILVALILAIALLVFIVAFTVKRWRKH
jgi:hypothetical protein